MSNSLKNKIHLRAKDSLVSNEEFEIIATKIEGLLKTSPTPSEDKIGNYYQSENYISHTDSTKTFIDKLYQIIKSYSLKRKNK